VNVESALLDIDRLADDGAEPAVEALQLGKRYRPRHIAALVPIPWFRRSPGLVPAPYDGDIGGDDDDDEDDEEELENDLEPDDDRDVWALRDVSFALPPGRVLGVVGGNASGKSTLIRVLSGITGPTEGVAITRGRVAPTIEIVTAFLDRPKSGEQCIFQIARFLRIPRSVAVAAVEPIREFTELGDALGVAVRTYSSGQAQRLAYAISLFLDPDIVLADGRVVVGDRDFRGRCMTELQRRIDAGLTVVVATHDVKLLRTLCTDALLLRDGHVEAFGPAEEVAAEYEGANLPKVVPELELDDGPSAAEEPLEEPQEERTEQGEQEEPETAPEPLAMRSARIYDMRGRPLDLVRVGQDTVIEVSFDLREAQKDIQVVLTLTTEDRTRMRIPQRRLFHAAEPGLYVASVHIPRRTLTAPLYKARATVIERVDDERTVLGEMSFVFETFDDVGEQRKPLASKALRRLSWEVARVSD
jgi:ABC-type polysaccharide/polyol phosphate transport system ATPase subunit